MNTNEESCQTMTINTREGKQLALHSNKFTRHHFKKFEGTDKLIRNYYSTGTISMEWFFKIIINSTNMFYME
jgi:hypothetical protein